jgi:RNA polymerase sigma-70 factor (ECF subfamily)
MAGRSFESLTHAVEAYYDELRRFLLDRTGSPAVADDVIQEAWLRSRTTTVEMPSNPRAYLYRLVGNLAIDHLRRDGRQARVADALLPEQVARPDPAADIVVQARQTLAIIAEAVAELPPRCREVFTLYRGNGLTVRQIAARLGTSEKTVEKQVAKAMLHCRHRLRDAGLAP